MEGTPWHAGISVVVLTYNRRDTLCRTLRHLQALPERPRIAVVDNGSTDGTAAMVRDTFPQIACLRSDTNLGAAGRNLGAQWAAQVAGTPYVAFCDDDCWWQAGSLARACALFDAHPAVVSLTARILVGASDREDPASTLMARSPLPSADLPGRAILGLMAQRPSAPTPSWLRAATTRGSSSGARKACSHGSWPRAAG
jgi:GT2 family glycosyltransferase